MPAYNFPPRFADLVESGRKTQTIRKTSRAKAWDQAHLFTGQRTKKCRKLGKGVITSVRSFMMLAGKVQEEPFIVISCLPLDPAHFSDFAGADGFESMADMVRFFDELYGLPFDGYLIQWKLS